MRIDGTQIKKTMNPAFVPLLSDKHKYLVIWGGAGSGKSWFTAQKILLRILKAMERGKPERILCLRKTQPAARRSIFQGFLDILKIWDLRGLYKLKLAAMEIEFNGGSKIICGGLDDPDKIKSIAGLTSAWIEEATEVSPRDFDQVNLRVRGEPPSYHQIILTFNPIDIESWIKRRFFDEDPQPEETSLHHSTYTDNTFDKTYETTLNSLTDDNQIRVYKYGQWGELRGLIYDNYTITDEWPVEQFSPHGYGLDFGFTNDPTACVECGFVGNSAYIRELLYSKGLTNDDVAATLQDKIEWKNSYICADSAEPKSIEELRRLKLPVIACTKGPDSVNHGIQRVKQFDLKVHASAIWTIRELRAYKWAEDKHGTMLNKPVDAFNHALDAMRYIIVHLKGMVTPDIDFGSYDERDERKELLKSDSYNFIEDEEIWDEI